MSIRSRVIFSPLGPMKIHAVISCRISFSVSGAVALIDNTDMLVKIGDFYKVSRGAFRLIWTNDGAVGMNNYIQGWDQLAGVNVGSEYQDVIAAAGVYQIYQTPRFALPWGLKSIMIKAGTKDGSTLTVDKAELIIMRRA